MSAALIMGAVNTAALTHRAVTSVCVLLVKRSIGTRKTVLVSPPFVPRLEISHNVCRFHGNAPRLSLRGGKASRMESRHLVLSSAASRQVEGRCVRCPVCQTHFSWQVSTSLFGISVEVS